LETRLGHAEKKLAALTPPRGRGKRQITDETALAEAIDTVLQDHRVHGLLSVAWEKQIERKTQYVGRGRGSASRQQRVLETVRYHITRIARQGDTITALTQQFGWKAFVTNAVHSRLSLQEAVLCYRNEYRVERLFNRLKSRVHIAPLFVKRNEQIEGLTYLLTLGVRVLTVLEFVLRRSLESEHAKLPGCTGKQAKDGGQADCRADPASVSENFVDHHQEWCRRGNPAAADPLIRGTGSHPATAGIGD